MKIKVEIETYLVPQIFFPTTSFQIGGTVVVLLPTHYNMNVVLLDERFVQQSFSTRWISNDFAHKFTIGHS